MSRTSAAVLVAIALVACGGESSPREGAASEGTIRLYTSVTQATVDMVVAAYTEAHPEATVELFRAPTGEVNARIAAELREGGVTADVLWLTDPLSMQQYDADGLLLEWEPSGAGTLSGDYRADTFWGTRILNMVIIHQAELDPAPRSWTDLLNPAYAGAVAIPDPGFAGSAFGALGYFALTDGFGLDYYRALRANGAVQVKSPGDVVTGVAEGQFRVGMTLDFTARSAVDKGSPVELVWPEPGAIAMYSPIAVFAASDNQATARSFADFVLSRPAQEAIAATGWQPVDPEVDWPYRGPQVTVDWAEAFNRQDQLLREYRAVFGG